jgi:hypothetical protein
MAEDQTKVEWIEQYGTAAARGTGVFLGSTKTEARVLTLTRNITHARCIEIAQEHSYRAFKWIPHAIATYAQVQGSRCPVRGEPCAVSCRGLACLCDPDGKICVDAPSGGGSLLELAPAMAGHQVVMA